MELTNHIMQIITKQKMLGYHFPDILQKPANQNSIHQIETKLNLKFNAELIELYSYANGTNSDFAYRSRLISLIPFYEFLSLDEATYYHQNNISEDCSFYNRDNDYMPGKQLFPFLEQDGGDCFWVDLNVESDHYNKIFWTNTQTQEPDYLFNSLTSMFKTISECYENGIIHIGANGFLSCDYSEWANFARKNNPDLRYWQEYNKS